jgi:hypothetical protein
MPSADPKPAPTDESAAARLCRQQRSALQDDPAITEKQMFGTTALCAGGKVFLFPWKDALVAKLPAPQAERLVASGNTALSGPGHGRTSKTWVAVSAQPRGRWERLAQDARAFAAG